MYWILAFLFSVIVTVLGQSGVCPHGWDEFADSCIYFGVSSKHSWRDSQAICRNMNHSYLMTDDNEMKHKFVAQIANALSNARINGFWIGGSDFAIESQWHWLETGRNVGPYLKWGTGQPNGNGTENCMAYGWEQNELVWIDNNCHTKHFFICEREALPSGMGVIGK